MYSFKVSPESATSLYIPAAGSQPTSSAPSAEASCTADARVSGLACRV